jgi:hypothetical protein
MTISVQSPTTALPALDTLVGAQTNAGALAPDQAGSQGLQERSGAQPSAILDLSSTGGIAAQTQGLAQAATIVDAAVSDGGAVTSLLAQMRQAALSAADPATTADARTQLSQGFRSDLARIDQLVSQANVGGVNLLDGSVQGALAVGGAPGDAGAVALNGTNLSLAGPVLGLSASADIADPATATSLADALGAAGGRAQAAVDGLAAQGQAIQAHLGVIIQAGLSLSPSLSGGVASAIDQDGARLQALQVQQGQTAMVMLQ